MNPIAAAKSSPVILRNAAGEPPLGIGGLAFRDDQGEMFEHDNPRYRSPASRIGVLELDDGQWLAHPPGFRVADLLFRFESREKALRYAIAEVIRRARRYARNSAGEGTHWSEGYAGRVIEWALSLKPATKGNPNSVLGVERTPEEITDPVIAALIEAKCVRQAWPAGHMFSMTNPIVNGQMMTVGTCECGAVLSYTWGRHERMDAAIEAHLQKFDHLPGKVDGRGFPIGEAAPAAKPKRPRKRKEPDAGMSAEAPASQGAKAGGHPASIIAEAPSHAPLRSEPAPEPAPLGAGSLISDQAAPIGAGTIASDMAAEPADDWSPMLAAALDLAWREPPKVSESLNALLDFSKVYAIGAEVTRPVLRWHGGKWKLAPWIIEHFQPHRVYVEPFGGAGSVLMRKLPALTEIYNDLDVEVVNLFRVLRSADAPRLIEQLRLTPFGREEFDEAFEFSADQVERARRLIVRSFFAGGSRGVLDLDRTMAGFNGGSARSPGDNPNSSHARDWSNYADTLPAAVSRLMPVIIENRPAIELMRQHDAEETLFYVDPPYIADTRSDRARKAYRHELDDDQHRELLGVLKTLSGMVVLSGYAHPMYDETLTDWRRIERGAMADGAQPRTEVLWINPACAAGLDVQHPRLFDLATLDVANTPPPDVAERSDAAS